MKPSELLRQKGWCQEHAAIDRDGRPVNVQNSSAVAFCAWGAITACKGHCDPDQDDAICELYSDLGSVVVWNDKPERTAEEVIAKLEEFGL